MVPITAAGLALLAFNYARFGNLAEFGQNYQMAGDNQNALRHFGLDFIPFNLRVYFWEPMRWIRYFPFVTGIEIPPAPPGQFGVENPFGVLTNVPVVWFALGAALVGWRWRAAGERALRGWLAAAALVFALCALFIACFGGACNRYEVEFLVVLVVVAVVGIFAVERALAARPAGATPAAAAWPTPMLRPAVSGEPGRGRLSVPVRSCACCTTCSGACLAARTEHRPVAMTVTRMASPRLSS